MAAGFHMLVKDDFCKVLNKKNAMIQVSVGGENDYFSDVAGKFNVEMFKFISRGRYKDGYVPVR